MSARVVPIFSTANERSEIEQATALIAGGSLVVVPTETVYGVAGLMTQPPALTALKEIRQSGGNTPFTLHLASADDARQYLGQISDLGNRMLRKVWPGPVGLVFDVAADRRSAVAAKLGLAESELYSREGTITLRCPDDPVARGVIGGVDGPVALTAVGEAGQSAAALGELLGDKVSLILDAGPTRYHQPSTIVRVTGDTYSVVRKGIYDERIIERMLRTTILFVCSGNTCRSPMAEAITRQLLAKANGVSEADLERKGISVISAGAYASPGARATPQAVEAVQAFGADLSNHRSRQLTPELIHQADVIFTMGRGHALAVLAMSPSASQKVSMINPTGDIDDPIGGNVELYRSLAGELQKLIQQRLVERELLPAGA